MRSLTKYLCAPILVILVVFSGCKKQQNQDAARPPEKPAVEKPSDPVTKTPTQPEQSTELLQAVDFTLKNYDGTEVTLSDYKGKIVVLEWFNYDCPFSKHHYEQADTMISLAAKYKEKGVVWLAINSTSYLDNEKTEQFAQKNDIKSPILDDSNGKVGRAYNAKTTPHMFVIDKQGNIVYNGAIDNSPLSRASEPLKNYVDLVVSELLEGKDVSVRQTTPYGCSVKYAN